MYVLHRYTSCNVVNVNLLVPRYTKAMLEVQTYKSGLGFTNAFVLYRYALVHVNY